jgi:hypothetical protein
MPSLRLITSPQKKKKKPTRLCIDHTGAAISSSGEKVRADQIKKGAFCPQLAEFDASRVPAGHSHIPFSKFSFSCLCNLVRSTTTASSSSSSFSLSSLSSSFFLTRVILAVCGFLSSSSSDHNRIIIGSLSLQIFGPPSCPFKKPACNS